MKKFFIVLCFILTAAAAFCDSYYVCLGSFTEKKNAIALVKDLRTRNVETFIYTVVVPGTTRYRVLLNEPSDRADDARMLRNLITNAGYVQELGLTGLWVCFAPEPSGEEDYEEYDDENEDINPPDDTSSDLVPITETVIVDETDDQTEILAEPDEETDDLLEHSLPIEVINVVSNDETDEVTVEPEIMKTPPVEDDILPNMNITFCDMTDDETADTTPEPEIAEPEPIVLAANSRDKMRLSGEFPYSVMVRSYKEEQNANGDADRLCDDDWDAYVVKSYDDETYFSFDVLVSAYKTEDEAAEVVRQFEEKGIHGTEIVEYGKVRQRADRYDEVVRTQNVIFDSGNGQMSNIFGDYVRRAVEGFPLNPFYDIRNITVTDNDSQSERMQTSPDNGEFAEWVADGSHVHALVSAEYHDELYNKSMFVSIAAGDSGDFILEEEAVGVRVKVQAKGDTYSGVKYQTAAGWQLVAKNADGSLIIHFASDNIGQSELDMFIGEIDRQSNLLSLSPIRKTLCVLPQSADFNAQFMTFELNKVETDYVKEKNSVEWAIPMVGHWKSSAWLVKSGDDYFVSFFDLDYDYVAEQTHKLFSAEHKNAKITEYNHSVPIGGKEGWYIYNNSSAELSFSTKSYIIAVGTQYHYENDLTDLGSALQIWNK